MWISSRLALLILGCIHWLTSPSPKDVLKYMLFVSREVYEWLRSTKIGKYLPFLLCRLTSSCQVLIPKLPRGPIMNQKNIFSKISRCHFSIMLHLIFVYFQSSCTFWEESWSKVSMSYLCYFCNIPQLMRSCFSWCTLSRLPHVFFNESIRKFNLP